MDMRSALVRSASVLTLSAAAAAQCDVVSLAGDKDTFGTGKPLGATSSVAEMVGEGSFFDDHRSGVFAWTHTFTPPVQPTAMTLTVSTIDVEDDGAGDGLGGAPYDTRLFVDGDEVPGAFDDVFTIDGNGFFQFTPNVVVFDLTPWVSSAADGVIEIVLNSNAGSKNDAIAIDFAELVVTDATCSGPWTLEGCSKDGFFGAPRLSGVGDLLPGSSNAVTLEAAASLAFAGLFVSTTSQPTPFKGGVLKPLPVIDPLALTTDAVGSVTLPFTTPGLPSGAELWFQWAVLDDAATAGVSLSNALRATFP